MKKFPFDNFPEELKSVVHEIPSIDVNEMGDALFKVVTQADPEWGNIHVPLALYLVKQGANKGEVVIIKGIYRTDVVD